MAERLHVPISCVLALPARELDLQILYMEITRGGETPETITPETERARVLAVLGGRYETRKRKKGAKLPLKRI